MFKVFPVKLYQQPVKLLLLPLLRAMLAENLPQPPDEVAVCQYPFVKPLEQRPQIDYLLRPDCHQLVIEGARRPIFQR